MKLIYKLELLGFYWCERSVCSEVDPSELFLIAYNPLISVVEKNISEELRLKSTDKSPVFLFVDKEKYRKHVKEIFNKLIAKFQYNDRIEKFKIRPRTDNKIFISPSEGLYLRKYPAALFAIHENTSSILVIREARFYKKEYFLGELILREPDFNKIHRYALIEEPFVLSLRNIINLDIKVITEFYRSPLRFVESAFLYVRPFYPLFISQKRDIDKELRRNIIKAFLLKEMEYAVVLGDFGVDQFAIGTIDDRIVDIVITDPEIAYIPNPNKLNKIIGLLYEQLLKIGATKLFYEVWKRRKEVGKKADYTFKTLEESMRAYKNGRYIDYLNAIYSNTRMGKENY